MLTPRATRRYRADPPVMIAEGCPRSAIVKVEEIKP